MGKKDDEQGSSFNIQFSQISQSTLLTLATLLAILLGLAIYKNACINTQWFSIACSTEAFTNEQSSKPVSSIDEIDSKNQTHDTASIKEQTGSFNTDENLNLQQPVVNNPNTNSPDKVSVQEADTSSLDASTSDTVSSLDIGINQDNSTSQANRNTDSVDSLNEKEAILLVENWLSAKPAIFAPPYDRELAAKYTTGKLYEDLQREVRWLENNGAYFTYTNASTNKIWAFDNFEDRAELLIHMSWGSNFYNSRGLERSENKVQNVRFIFVQENDVWKISDFKGEE